MQQHTWNKECQQKYQLIDIAMKHVFIFLIILIFAGCNASNQNISSQLEKIAMGSLNDTVCFSFKEITPHYFDKFIIIPPYVRIDKLGKQLHVDLDLIRVSNIESRDDIYVLCIITNNKVQDFYYLYRSHFNYEGIVDFKLHKGAEKIKIIKKMGQYFIVK